MVLAQFTTNYNLEKTGSHPKSSIIRGGSRGEWPHRLHQREIGEGRDTEVDGEIFEGGHIRDSLIIIRNLINATTDYFSFSSITVASWMARKAIYRGEIFENSLYEHAMKFLRRVYGIINR